MFIANSLFLNNSVLFLVQLTLVYCVILLFVENEENKPKMVKFKENEDQIVLPWINKASGLVQNYHDYNCSQEWTSIIVPYRDREHHLPHFLKAISDHQILRGEAFVSLSHLQIA